MADETKKLINDPDAVIEEMLDGLVGAFPDLIHRPGPTGRAVAALDGPRPGKVGIVIGGGSGHEPAFAMYVGRGLADAAAVGNVFASPGPSQVTDAARAADGGAGVLFLYGNYAGDVMNFDMAAERLAAEGVEARTMLVTDDVASAPPDRAGERRGIAGGFFVFKCAGAAADLGHGLPEVERLARHANAMTRSMGVALSPCSLPQTRRPNFDIPAGQMEVGMGIHGEPGVARLPLEPADAVADRLLAPVAEELALARGDDVAVLVNGLGSTSLMELLILHRRVKAGLDARGVAIRRSWVGEYVTALEMGGASVSVLKLDAGLDRLLAHPCRTPALVVGEPARPVARPATRATSGAAVDAGPAAGTGAASGEELEEGGEVTPAVFRAMMAACGARVIAARDELSALDGATGDGDHGVTMEAGWRAVARALAAMPPDASIRALCAGIADAFLDAVGASAGPLYATAFARAGEAVARRRDLDASSMVAWIEAMARGIEERGGAAEGDKTMLDAWAPAARAARAALDGGGSLRACLEAAARAAAEGRDATAAMLARKGRAAKLGERSLGHIDPGAASATILIGALGESWRDPPEERLGAGPP